ncbi:MAG: anthranilate synthase component I [Candidatus Krumholzibacteriia bacterium]
MISPNRAQYLAEAAGPARAPLRARIPADLETPVSVFLKLQEQGAAFLLESVERGVQVGRYSFVGLRPRTVISLKDGKVVTTRSDATGSRTEAVEPAGDDPLAPIRQELERAPLVADEDGDLPPPFGGAVGYLGYDIVRDFDGIPLPEGGGPDLPDFHFLFPRTMVVFDHVKNQIEVLTIPEEGDPGAAHAAATAEIEQVLAALGSPLDVPVRRTAAQVSGGSQDPVQGLEAEIPRADFEAMVTRAQEHILAGDAFQIVLSQRLGGRTEENPFQVYRALRILNPSPYLFFLDCGGFQLIGSSPEMLVRLEGDRLQVNPIAGTRPRGETVAEDARLAEELLADQKERAEHVMLVDLGRNDLGRVCRTGTVQVDDFMTVERYSHVMHLVSRVSGELEAGRDMFDALRAVFPAGTVSGAPKIRAMQIIGELEGRRRGPYAGAVGYFGQRGDMDMCITIRTLLMQGDRFSVQAGAGIVADSVPEREFTETLDKIRALTRAVRIAEEGL